MTLEEKVKEPVKEQLTTIAGEIKDDMQAPAQEAVQSMKETATDAARAIKDQGALTPPRTVRAEAQEATDEVRSTVGQRPSGATPNTD